jgi:hypothetical protein
MMTLAADKLSKAQLEERKKSWEDILYRIEYSGRHTKKELKIFEAYYLRGTQPKQHPLYKDPIPLVYRLWLCPDQSEESWRAVTEQLLAGPAVWHTDISLVPVDGYEQEYWPEPNAGRGWWQIQTSLNESSEILWEHGDSDCYDGVSSFEGSTLIAPLGFMGGAEQRLVEFLTAPKESVNHYEYLGKPLFKISRGFSHVIYRYLCIWLDGRRPHNPYIVSRYMAEPWFLTLSDQYFKEVFKSETLSFHLSCYLQLIARFPEPEAEFASSERHIYAQKIRAMLDHRPIRPVLKTLWLSAKNYTGAIDLNALDFKYKDHPDDQPEHYYVGEF